MDALQQTLRPVLRSLPAPIHSGAIALLGRQCHRKLLLDADLRAQACLKLAISKVLGLGIVVGSAGVKLPQILKLVSSGKATGISSLGYALETASYVIGLAYSVRRGFPFSTYGETAFIAVQNIVIAVLVLHLRRQGAAAAAFVTGLAAVLYAVLFSGDRFVDLHGLGWLQAGASVLNLASKLPQIWTIYREGGTGQLSAFAVFNFLAGSLFRIFTTLQEIDDPLILWGFIVACFLNAVIAAQMVYYWNGTATTRVAGKRTPARPRRTKRRAKKEPPSDASYTASDASSSDRLLTPEKKGRALRSRRKA